MTWTAEVGHVSQKGFRNLKKCSQRNELLGTLSDCIILGKVTTDMLTPIIGRSTQLSVLVILNSESRSGLERHIDNARVYSADIWSRVQRRRDCPPIRRVRERTDKMEREKLMMVTVVSAVHSDGLLVVLE
jgi:hypothetical protein